jgi:hypothetical protein
MVGLMACALIFGTDCLTSRSDDIHPSAFRHHSPRRMSLCNMSVGAATGADETTILAQMRSYVNDHAAQLLQLIAMCASEVWRRLTPR